MIPGGPRPAVHAFALLGLLAASLALPGAFAQAGQEDFYGVQIEPHQASVYVPFLGTGRVNVTLVDVSTVRAPVLSTAPTPARIILRAEVVGNDTQGWVASVSSSSLVTQPGEVHDISLNVQPGAGLVSPQVTVVIRATYVDPFGTRHESNASVLGVVQPFRFVVMLPEGIPQPMEPDGEGLLGFEVRNGNYYPEMISFEASGPPGWVVTPPTTIMLGPGETETVYFHVKAPDTPFFLLFGTSRPLSVVAQMSSDPTARYTTTVAVPYAGGFLPGWVLPHVFLLFLGLIMAVRVTAERREEKRLEKGKPTYPGLSPEEEARISALKKSDPERAKAMEERLRAIHKKRVATWKQVYGKRRELDKEMGKREKARHDALLAAQKRKDRERKREEKRAAKQRKAREREKNKQLKKLEKRKAKAQKAAAKAQRKEEARVRAEMETEAKAKRKRVKKLEKRKAKAQGKVDKREGKAAKRKAKQLSKLQKRKQKLERRKEREDKGPFWKFWGR